MKVKYIGASDSQVNWGGNDDPRSVLELNKIYDLYDQDVHTWHTKYYLVGFEKLGFNSVSFEEVEDE